MDFIKNLFGKISYLIFFVVPAAFSTMLELTIITAAAVTIFVGTIVAAFVAATMQKAEILKDKAAERKEEDKAAFAAKAAEAEAEV